MRTVIMGGSSGIGLATAELLAGDGAEVIVTGRDETKLAAVRPRVASAERVDGTSPDEVAAFFERTGSFKHLVLAFSQGAEGFGPLRELDPEAIRIVFDGKTVPYLLATQRAQVTNSITLVSGASARGNTPGTAALAAANGAIVRAVPPLAAELAPVRVNAVSPGVIDTPWWSFLDEQQRRAQFEELRDSLPAGRVGRPQDVADGIRYLIGASYVTGAVLPIDGGLTVG